MTRHPKIFHVNWFRTDKKGEFLWPGYGENLRVLEWIIDRCEHTAEAEKTPIGYIPTQRSLDMTGLELPSKKITQLLSINKQEWKKELDDQEVFLSRFGKDLPAELCEELSAQRKRFNTSP